MRSWLAGGSYFSSSKANPCYARQLLEWRRVLRAAEYNSLVLLERYLEKYPEDADKIVLSIKGGASP